MFSDLSWIIKLRYSSSKWIRTVHFIFFSYLIQSNERKKVWKSQTIIKTYDGIMLIKKRQKKNAYDFCFFLRCCVSIDYQCRDQCCFYTNQFYVHWLFHLIHFNLWSVYQDNRIENKTTNKRFQMIEVSIVVVFIWNSKIEFLFSSG